MASRFDEAAAQWDNNPGRVHLARAVGEAIGRAVPFQPDWRALDYGAGTGLLTLNLQPRVASMVALDSSKAMLEKLTQKLAAAAITNVQTRHWDLEAKPFPETGFDLVVSSMTLHHLRNVPLVFGRLAELLKPGGWLAVADLDTEDGSFHGQADDVFHHGFERGQVTQWLANAGLKWVSVSDAHSMNKPDPAGQLRSYGIFLAVAQKGRDLAGTTSNKVPMPKKVIIIGGVAAGPKAAAKIIRLNPEAEVTLLEKGKFISYAGCGLPYYVSGVVKEQKDLMSTPIGVLRDPGFFQKVKNVKVLTETEALEIDRAAKRVRARRQNDGGDFWLDYDNLVLATGARPVVPPLPKVNLANITTLHSLSDAEGIKTLVAGAKAREVVMIGGGLIGVEAVEALAECDCRVTLVEMMPQILRMLDWEMARLVERHLEAQGVTVMTDTNVTAFEGEGRVTGVLTSRGRLPADLVVLGIGVKPNVDLARSAGLQIGPTGAIHVDAGMRTSDPAIYAAGDCAENTDLVTGKPCYVPMGSTANKQGRVAAINVCGGQDQFPGVLGSTVCRVFDFCVARTGLTEAAARQHGYEVTTVLVPETDRPHYMPTAKLLISKLVVDARTRKLLGAQAVGPGAGDKRMDVAAMAITAGMTVDQLSKADLCYAPPYSPALDNIITAANVARNKLDGQVVGITPMEVKARLEAKEDFVLLDVRSPAEHQQEHLASSTLIPLGALRARLNELPKDKEIVAFCKVSLRGYEAARILQGAGFKCVRVMDGGTAVWPFEKIVAK